MPNNTDDAIFNSLRESTPYFEGDDFVNKVMVELPADNKLSERTKNLLILLATACGSILALWLVKDTIALPDVTLQVGSLSYLWLAGIALAAYAGMTSICASIIWVLRKEWV